MLAPLGDPARIAAFGIARVEQVPETVLGDFDELEIELELRRRIA